MCIFAHVCIQRVALGLSITAACVYQAASPVWFLEEMPVVSNHIPALKVLLCLKHEGDTLI